MACHCGWTTLCIPTLCMEGLIESGTPGTVPMKWGYYYKVRFDYRIHHLWDECPIRCIHHVLDALTSDLVYHAYVRLPGDDVTIPDVIRCSLKLRFFIDCIGALDGTHLPARVSLDHHPRYWNRKGQISQNVLAVYDLEMNFLYVLAGWEGSACDGWVFQSACDLDFTVLAGHYYLADTGLDVLLLPYCGVWYHLKEWGQASTRYIQATQ